MLKDIVEVLKEQRHGTSVIFMERDEAEQEVKRLCDMNRAIPVESNLKYNKTEEGERMDGIKQHFLESLIWMGH